MSPGHRSRKNPDPERRSNSSILAGGLRFNSVQECLEFLPTDERALTDTLRQLVLDTSPALKERISFNVPFYKAHRDICFIWPAAVLWGAKKTYAGVRFGLSYGSLLPNVEPYLQRGERKQVCWREFTTITPMDERTIQELLMEAMHYDMERHRGLR